MRRLLKAGLAIGSTRAHAAHRERDERRGPAPDTVLLVPGPNQVEPGTPIVPVEAVLTDVGVGGEVGRRRRAGRRPGERDALGGEAFELDGADL